MTVTVFPSSTKFHDGTSPDLTLLNVSRLLARLEHNLLSPGADLKPLRRSEYQRMRVNAVRLATDFAATLYLSSVYLENHQADRMCLPHAVEY